MFVFVMSPCAGLRLFATGSHPFGCTASERRLGARGREEYFQTRSSIARSGVRGVYPPGRTSGMAYSFANSGILHRVLFRHGGMAFVFDSHDVGAIRLGMSPVFVCRFSWIGCKAVERWTRPFRKGILAGIGWYRVVSMRRHGSSIAVYMEERINE